MIPEPASAPIMIEVPETATAVVAATVPKDELPSFFDRSFGLLGATLAEQGVAILGPAFARYDGPMGEAIELEVGFPIDGVLVETGEVKTGSLPGGRAAHLSHLGGYDGLAASWECLTTWTVDQGLSISAIWEVYVTEPSPDMDPATLRTDLYALLE